MRALRMIVMGTMLVAAVGSSANEAANDGPAVVVRGFLDQVRSGRDPSAVARFFAPKVAAHQLTSEGETTVVRTPADYAAHVHEFLALFGAFDFRVEELIAQGDRVHVRWRQRGRHLGSLDGEKPTGAPLTEISSAVYRVEGGRIVEYWIQTDRKGLELQLARARR